MARLPLLRLSGPRAPTGPPTPINPPGPTGPTPPGGPISRSADPLAKEKERRTSIIRVWGQGEDSEDLWVDLEVIDNATFSGSQWPGFDAGNQAQDTILKITNTPGLAGNRERSFAKVQIDPANLNYFVNVPVIESILLQIAGGEKLKRSFANGRENSTTDQQKVKTGDIRKRIQVGIRISSNNIDDEFLVPAVGDTADGHRNAPPSNPKDYIKAVQQTDEESAIFLNIYLPFGFWLKRNKFLNWTGMHFVRLWFQKAVLKLPGARNSDPGEIHVVTDPYQTIVNFGPDSLAVEFYDGAA